MRKESVGQKFHTKENNKMKSFKYIKIPAVLLGLIFTSGLYAENADEIMKKNDALPEGETMQREAVLLIVKSGKNEKKEFSGVSKIYGRKKRSRMQFTYPSKMGFLSWDIPGADNQQWIKLTNGKVRKIASSDKDKPWMNSHFAYEDIAENYIEDYVYTLLGEAEVSGITCYKIESVKTRGQKVYSKRIIYIGKEDYLMYKVEYYEKGQHTKTLLLENYEAISGIMTARKLTMERTDGRGKSILYLKSVKYNVSVNDNELTQEAF